MSLFLFKPHVEGPEGNITTPDIVIDRMFIGSTPMPLTVLTTELYHQAEPGGQASSTYALTALGGGALISPVVQLSTGSIVLARKAWRLKNLSGHLDAVALNESSLVELGRPSELISANGGSEEVLPRGFLVICENSVPGDRATLSDGRLGRSLDHQVVLEDVTADRWDGRRPNPRYSVGPTKREIPHFI